MCELNETTKVVCIYTPPHTHAASSSIQRRLLGWVCVAMHVLHFATSRLFFCCVLENSAFGTMSWQPLHHCQTPLWCTVAGLSSRRSVAAALAFASRSPAGWGRTRPGMLENQNLRHAKST
jgi:hypothetical protein